MRATFCALEPEGNRYRFPSVRGHGPLPQNIFVGGRHAGDPRCRGHGPQLVVEAFQ